MSDTPTIEASQAAAFYVQQVVKCHFCGGMTAGASTVPCAACLGTGYLNVAPAPVTITTYNGEGQQLRAELTELRTQLSTERASHAALQQLVREWVTTEDAYNTVALTRISAMHDPSRDREFLQLRATQNEAEERFLEAARVLRAALPTPVSGL